MNRTFLTTLTALSTFAIWSVMTVYAGIWTERKRAERAQRQRIEAFMAMMPKPEPKRPVPSAETVRRAQA